LESDRLCNRKSLGEVISGDEIRQWKDLPMVAYERAVWFKLGQNEERMVWQFSVMFYIGAIYHSFS